MNGFWKEIQSKFYLFLPRTATVVSLCDQYIFLISPKYDDQVFIDSTKTFKFLNQCFARLRCWKSVSNHKTCLQLPTAVLLETLFQYRSHAKHWFKHFSTLGKQNCRFKSQAVHIRRIKQKSIRKLHLSYFFSPSQGLCPLWYNRFIVYETGCRGLKKTYSKKINRNYELLCFI